MRWFNFFEIKDCLAVLDLIGNLLVWKKTELENIC